MLFKSAGNVFGTLDEERNVLKAETDLAEADITPQGHLHYGHEVSVFAKNATLDQRRRRKRKERRIRWRRRSKVVFRRAYAEGEDIYPQEAESDNS